MVVFRSDGKYIKDNRVIGALITCDSLSVEIIGSSMEFKVKSVHLKSKPSELAQACVNMLRVAGFWLKKLYKKINLLRRLAAIKPQ